MQLFFIVLIFCFILFLFRLYHLAIDDYVLIKKSVSLEDVFNAAFICCLFALFSSRLFYVLFNYSSDFLNPLVFLLFPYFPGLSLAGGIIGAAIFLLLYGRRNKFPVSRVFDFFTVAFLFCFPPGLIGFILLSSNFTQGQGVKLGLFLLMFILTSIYLYPKASSLEIKDGSLSMLFLIFYSLIALFTNAIDNPGLSSFLSDRENFVLIFLLLLGSGLLVKQELAGRINFGK